MTNQTVSMREVSGHYSLSTQTSLYGKVQRAFFGKTSVRRTVQQVYAQFAQMHPECEEMLFNGHLMQQRIIPLVQQAYREGTLLSLTKLLWAWNGQFGPACDNVRLNRQQQMTPLAMAFLAKLNIALS